MPSPFVRWGMKAILLSLSIVFLALFEPWGATAQEECLDKAKATRWTVEVRDGIAWFITPCGREFFSVGINVFDGGEFVGQLEGRRCYHWTRFYPSLAEWVSNARTRILGWGFNTAGAWSLDPSLTRMPLTPQLDLGRTTGFHWSDPFDPFNEERLLVQARRLVAPYKESPYRIGYFSDNEQGWWNGANFVWFIKKPSSNHTKRRLVGLLRGHYGEDWVAFCRDFVVPKGVGSFDDLLENVGPVFVRPGGNGIQAVRRWTGVLAEHYYRLVHLALRKADPDALILGDRLPIYYDPDAVRSMGPYVDVISTNYNVDSHDGWIARYFFDGLRRLAPGRPILISEWFFAAQENRTGNLNRGHLMTVKTQAERAAGAARAAEAFARDPMIVGMHWFQYFDHPQGGRADGEDYNFGLVDVEDRPYEELVAALRDLNRRVAEIHRKAKTASNRALNDLMAIPEASIEPKDSSLAEWPKERALLPPFRAPLPEIPFGEAYASWDRRGINMAFIGMDYYDPEILAFDGDFPLGEAFRMDLGVDLGKGGRRFSFYLIPPKEGDVNARKEIRVCRDLQLPCRPAQEVVAHYFGADQPRIIVEISIPWRSLGSEGPPPGGELRLEVAATAFHRSRWMSLSGLDPTQALDNPATWRRTRLEKAQAEVSQRCP